MESIFAMIQMECMPEPAENLKKAGLFAENAVKKYHPDFLLFPETFMTEILRGSIEERNARAETLDGPFVEGMRKIASGHGVWIAFGMKEKTPDPGDPRVYNSVVILNAEGDIVQVYHKTHLYDAFGFRESDEVKAGDVVLVLEAMKMANNLEAEKSGKVTAILVSQGASVMEDSPLIVIE